MWCRGGQGYLEDHIVGHLRFLALKSLPPYQDEGSEGSRSENGSLGNSKLPSRSTIKKDPERYLKSTFDDIGDKSSTQGRDGGDRTAPGPYAAWGGYRNYVSLFPAGLKKAPMATDATTLGMSFMPPQLCPTPPIPDDGEYQPPPWPKDPSTEFVDETLFAGVLDTYRRRFEWGFLNEAHGSSKSLENDPVSQSILKCKREKLSQKSIPPTQPKSSGPSAASDTTDEQEKVVSDSGNNDLESNTPLDPPTPFSSTMTDYLTDPDDVNEQESLPDGKLVASGSTDGTVRLWGAATGSALQTSCR